MGSLLVVSQLGCQTSEGPTDAATSRDAMTQRDAMTPQDASQDAAHADASQDAAHADASQDAAHAEDSGNSGDAGGDGCSEGHYDLNGFPADGCEFELDEDAIYVSTSDAAAVDQTGCGLGPVGTQQGAHPCRSIGFGLTEAVRVDRARVLVAAGLYTERVTLVDGKHLLGGHHPSTWERNPGANVSTVRPMAGAGHAKSVVADGITLPTVFEGFTVQGTDAVTSSANSYAFWIRDASSDLVIRDNHVFAGRGADGSSGTAGLEGTDGPDGQSGERYIETAAVSMCSQAPDVPGNVPQCFNASGTSVTTSCGAPGTQVCGGMSVSGGAGAGALCPSGTTAQNSGGVGSRSIAGGTAGTAGPGGSDRTCPNCGACNTGGMSAAGVAGMDGGPGANGAGGMGGTGSTVEASAEWRGGGGHAGTHGTPGGGAGGGGAGGGVDHTVLCAGIADTLGGSGGGGGAGGCGGTGGGAGDPGGGSFAFFIVFSAPSSSLPSLSNNTITLGTGGDGGRGGAGNRGGEGGEGGAGGGTAGAAWSFVLGAGGSGGNGGDGGHGAGGGGGAGGSSYGIYVHNHTVASTYGETNTLVTSGSAGSGGDGGLSLGSSGMAGAPGIVRNVEDEL